MIYVKLVSMMKKEMAGIRLNIIGIQREEIKDKMIMMQP